MTLPVRWETPSPVSPGGVAFDVTVNCPGRPDQIPVRGQVLVVR
jgi:hypothetical protein